MAWVRLIEPYETHKAGEIVDLPAVVARGLCHKKKAVCGKELHGDYQIATVSYPTRPIRVEVKEIKEETRETVYPNKFRIKNSTAKEIKSYLDKQGIKYRKNARKEDLIKLL